MVVVMVHGAGVGLGGLAVALPGWFVGWLVVIVTIFTMSSVTFLSSSSSVTLSSSSLHQHLAHPVIVPFAAAAVIIIIIAMAIVIITATVTSVTLLVSVTREWRREKTSKKTKEWSRRRIHNGPT